MDKRLLVAGLLVLIGLAVCFYFSLASVTRPDPSANVQTTPSTNAAKETSKRIKVASIFVDDQDKALTFYTKQLGLETKDDIPAGDYRWLTVVSPKAPEGMELLLEPNDHPAARTFQKAIFEDGIAATTLFVDDIQQQFERLKGLDVRFTMQPTEAGEVTIAVFDDTCGNLIQLVQQ